MYVVNEELKLIKVFMKIPRKKFGGGGVRVDVTEK